MTFRQKLNDMYQESLTIQRQFLKALEDVRKFTDKNEAVPEELIFRRDQHYNQFNQLLKKHHRLRKYTISHSIELDSEMNVDIDLIA
jgi:hypothetical protein